MRTLSAILILLVASLTTGCGKNGDEEPKAGAGEPASTVSQPTPGPVAESGSESAYSAMAYSACAVCHLADGAGIPGAFPPIRNRAGAIAVLDGGREYLMTVVAHGLMGSIRAGGQNYVGVMPGHSGTMDAAKIAAALNFAVFELSDDTEAVADVEPFTAAEVNAVTADVEAPSPMTAADLRTELTKRHGDEWPP